MATYRIVCVTKSTATTYGHGHITEVGVGTDPNVASSRQPVEIVRSNISNGALYYTQSPSTGKQAKVERYDCPCGVKTIRSNADAVTDNNLDNLRRCSWKS